MAFQATFIQEGKQVDYTPSSAVAAGDVVIDNGFKGFAARAIAANAGGALLVSGVVDLAHDAVQKEIGDVVFWNATGDPVGGTVGTGAATKTRGANVLMGRCINQALATDTTVRVLVFEDVAGETEALHLIPIEDLAANADIAARPFFVDPIDARELVEVGILTLGAPADVDDSNTVVIAIADDAANAIVTKTYNTADQPPSSDYESLGALAATHKLLAAAEHVTVAVTQGTTADMPAFFLVVRSRKTNE